MFKNNRNLVVVAVIALVNALGYGIVIPILYSYSIKYGLSDFQNGLLFSIFSVCQFISTPIIGRLSDKYGRKPLLTISIIGTALSFIMMAFAPSAIFLFLARALDGLTAGNIPVASAVIADTTEPKDRAKGFGIIGASFGFGFAVGPAISALFVGISLATPFLIAAAITVIAVFLTMTLLKETNAHMGEVPKGKLFDFGKMLKMLVDPAVGVTLSITLIYSFAFGLIIFGFQPYAVKLLGLNARTVSEIFTLFGFMGLVSQMFILPRVSKMLGDRRALEFALMVLGAAFVAMFLNRNFVVFVVISTILGVFNFFVNPLVQTILSKETDAKSQGSIMGLNFSYMSVGLIFGPIIGGALATLSLASPFLAAAAFALAALLLSFAIARRVTVKESAF
ncbi:MAG TPA: MFS transporter [Candidatus Saccharimonadales bacterium]|nr:MFS transporter [Candidatus Saccharimonadales bacterium]